MKCRFFLVLICFSVLFIQMSISFAQETVEIQILRGPDFLTIYVPGNENISLTGLGFEVVVGDTRETYLLADFADFKVLRFDDITTPICFHLMRDGSGVVMPSECSGLPAQRRLTQLLADPNVFWQDDTTDQARSLLIVKATDPVDVCPATVRRCIIQFPKSNLSTPSLLEENLTTPIAPNSVTPTPNSIVTLAPTEAGMSQIAVSAIIGNRDIYLINSDGSDPSGRVQLTDNPSQDDTPAWSPDGSKLAFATSRDGDLEIYVMNADGSNQMMLTNNEAVDLAPSWSPDGTKIIFSSERDGNREIYVMDANGSNQVNLTQNPDFDARATFSPDGTKIVFSSRPLNGAGDIYLMDADGKNRENITTHHNGNDFAPSWSPDGTKILFASIKGTSNSQIYVIDLQNGRQITRLTNTAMWENNPVFSPDGNLIVFNARNNPQALHELYIMNADGSNVQKIFNGTVSEYAPSWRP